MIDHEAMPCSVLWLTVDLLTFRKVTGFKQRFIPFTILGDRITIYYQINFYLLFVAILCTRVEKTPCITLDFSYLLVILKFLGWRYTE